MVGEPNFIIIMGNWREELISIQTMVGKKGYKFKQEKINNGFFKKSL